MDEVYRDYRITLKRDGIWTARVTHVRGGYIPLAASSTLGEGPESCLARARQLVDKYVAFLDNTDLGGEPT